MRTICQIAWKELRMYAGSLTAPLLLILFLIFTGYFTWFSDQSIPETGQAHLRVFFNTAYWTLFFFIPAVSMRLFAEEKRAGTLEWLIIHPVSTGQIVAGKFLGAVSLIAMALLLTAIYPVSLAIIGDPDSGEIISGYLGLILISVFYLSIGLFSSAISQNQIVAFLIGISIGILFHMVFESLAGSLSGIPSQVLGYLSVSGHMTSMARGVPDTADISFFVFAAIAFCLITSLIIRKQSHAPTRLSKLGKPVPYLLTIVSLIFILLLTNRFNIRIDITDNQEYTLSDVTKKVLKSLKNPVTIQACFSENLPYETNLTRQEFLDLVEEYQELSSVPIMVQEADPAQNSSLEKEITGAGIEPFLVSIREKDEVRQLKIYLGAVLRAGDQQAVIPYLVPGSSMEYYLTSSIKKLSVTDKKGLGHIAGHGEPSPSEMIQVKEALSSLYNYQAVRLDDPGIDLANYKTLCLVAPTDTIPQKQLELLETYLKDGGNLLIAINRVDAEDDEDYGVALNTGLEVWLAGKGIIVSPSFITDASCGAVTLRKPGSNQTQRIGFPYLPISGDFSKHPAVKGIESVLFEYASPISYTGTDYTFEPLVFSSIHSDTAIAPVVFDYNKKWTSEDFQSKNLVIAAVFSPVSGKTGGKIVVIGDGDFAVNGEREKALNLPPDQVNLFANLADWLTDDTGIIELRARTVSTRPLNELSENTLSILRYSNLLIPSVIVLIFSILRALFLRVKRRNAASHE